jgi:peptidyl-dipeptidase A
MNPLPFKLLAYHLLITAIFFSCSRPDEKGKEPSNAQAETYLQDYNKEYKDLSTKAAEAAWLLNTKIQEGDTITQKAYEEAAQKLTDFTGSLSNIDSSKKYLAISESLSPIQKKQMEYILFLAGGAPASAGETVKQLIKEGAEQTKVLYGFDFKIDGKSVTKNDISNLLTSSPNLNERLKAWRSSKEVGKPLKDGLERLRDLRNKSVQALGFSDFFAYQVSEYGMSTQEMLEMNDSFIREIWPLYRELHTWARFQLARKYKQPVPDFIPAHWLPNQWAQDWQAIADTESQGIDLTDTLNKKTPEWIVKKGEEFYISLGFDPLPASFYERSSLYPLPPDAPYKKNNHASAWHVDLDQDVRSLMSVETNTQWWETSLHELGHIYYFKAYSTPEVPVLLRGGANRAYHEAIGSQIGLASLQKPLLQSLKLIPDNLTTNDTLELLTDALQHIIVLPWASGTMTRFEEALYTKNIPVTEFNKTWWDLVKRYQGVVPPSIRGEEFCDGCTKTHIIDDPAQYYDYAMAEILLFQFHDHIANNILKQDVHATNYWGNKEVGNFLRTLMAPGASVDWREHLSKNLGTAVSAKPILDYFSPLMTWLKKQNEGRNHSLPESFSEL